MRTDTVKTIFSLAGQILPFVIITTTFICIARLGCDSFAPLAMHELSSPLLSHYDYAEATA